MCFLAYIHSFHDILWFSLTIKKNLFLIFDNYTEKFSFNLKVIDAYPFIRIVSFKFHSTISIQPIVFFNHQTNFFYQIHFRRNFPTNIFSKFQQNFLRIYTACAVILFILWIVEKFCLVTKNKWFYDVCSLLTTFIHFIKQANFIYF